MALLANLGQILDSPVIYEKDRFGGVSLSAETKSLLSQTLSGDALRRLNLFQRESRTNRRFHLAALDIADQICKDPVIEHRAAIERQVLEVERAQIQLDDRPGDGAGCGITPARPQRLQQAAEASAANHVDHGIIGIELQRGMSVEHFLRPQRAHRRVFGNAGQSSHLRAAAVGKLYRRRSDPARSAGHQYPLTSRNPAAVQQVFGGRIGAGKRGQLQIAECAINRMRVHGRGNGIFGKGTVAL
mgnify:CR=1 FL=1